MVDVQPVQLPLGLPDPFPANLSEIPKGFYVLAALGLIGFAAYTGSKWGAWFIILVILSMVSLALKRGDIST